MENMKCRFVAISTKAGIHDSFQIADGGTVFINGKERLVNYIDEYHFSIDKKCFHTFEFFERVVRGTGSNVLPGKGLVTREYGPNYRASVSGVYEIG